MVGERNRLTGIDMHSVMCIDRNIADQVNTGWVVWSVYSCANIHSEGNEDGAQQQGKRCAVLRDARKSHSHGATWEK
ncbi:hypothetical protein NX07_16660 [Xanthomonas vasicola]|nr:hypothetical protein NX07_16660 [Xanthomonas vasicola]